MPTRIYTIIYANLLPFIALLVFLLMSYRNFLFDKKQAKLFRIAIFINLVLLVAISVDSFFISPTQLPPFWWAIRRFTSFLNFAAAPVIPLILYKIFSRRSSRFLLYIPALLNALLSFLSMFFPVIFFIGTDNTYTREFLFLFPFSITVIYLLLLIVSMRRFGRKGVRSERLFLSFTIAALCLCMYLEIALRFRFLTWDCTAVSLILYYLLINVSNSNSDPLTGIYNRAMYMKTLSEIDRTIPCTIAVLDLNHFKKINDTLGHAVGDEYLIRFAALLQNETDKHTGAFRIGGDEFALVSKSWDLNTMTQHLEHALSKAHMQKFDFAYGVVSSTPTDSIEAILKEADDLMYEHKKATKEKASAISNS